MYFFISSPGSSRIPKTINKTYNTFCTDECLKGIVDGKLQCNCGEDSPYYDWSWESDSTPNIKIFDGCKEVLFHPVYSSGTAAVRGNKPFQQNWHYYWEIKITSKLYGTDVMIGVGTSRMDFSDWRYKFSSLLGMDSQSWGYSYHGNIQHNKLKRKYGTQYGLGSIIGLHLDMCNGTLEYFLNRKPLGIAFKNLKGKELYPMVCSTAAQSTIRISCCISKKPTLQMLCLEKVMKYPNLHKQYCKIPGLTKMYDKQYFWIVPQCESDEKKRLAELDEDLTLSLFDERYLSKNKKFKPIRLISVLYDEELEDDGSDMSDFYHVDTSDKSNSVQNREDISKFLSELPHDVVSDPEKPSTSRDLSSSHQSKPKEMKCYKMCTEESIKCISCRLRSEEDDSSNDSLGLTPII